jgi:hypothetical protein
MRRETLLEVLNAEARTLSSSAITERMLRDWIAEDLFLGPTEKGLGRGLGSERRYSPAALAAALEVVRLKTSGARRYATLRLRLWLLNFDVPMDRITEDLRSEFDRLLRRGFFRNPLRYDTHSDEEYSAREIQAELRRAGSIDPDLGGRGARAAFRRPAKRCFRIGLGLRGPYAAPRVVRNAYFAVRL